MALGEDASSAGGSDYQVLGPLAVIDGAGTPVPVSGSNHRLLLALLLAPAGRVVGVDELIEAIWGDDLPEDPRGSLQNLVWRVRRALRPDDPIETTPAGYRFTAPRRVDAVRFEEAVDAARRLGAPARAEPAFERWEPALERWEPALERWEPALERWETALSLWRGPAFVDLAGHPALALESARLEGVVIPQADDRPVRAVEGPPAHAGPAAFLVDPPGPGLGEGPLPGDHLRRAEPPVQQVAGIVQIEQRVAFLVQTVDAEGPGGCRQLGKAEHRRLPDGQVAECLADRGGGVEGEVADPVPVGVVQTPQPLIGMDVERMPRLVRSPRTAIVREDPVDQHYA